jgi:hypothetical protein
MKKLIASLVVCIAVGCGINTSPGNGEKIGQIVKVAKVGMISDTWEGEIVRGGFQGGNGANGQSFHFTIPSESMAKQAQSLMENQKEVLLTYQTKGIYSAFSSESMGHFAVSLAERPDKK